MTVRPLGTIALCVALVALFAFDPSTTWWCPSCPLRALTGWLCPLCGTLRAVHALLHGHPAVALVLNPLVTLGGCVSLTALLFDAIHPARFSRVERLLNLVFSPSGLILIIAFGVLRNVPFDRIITQ